MLATFDGVKDITENKGNSNSDSGNADHRHEGGFAPSEFSIFAARRFVSR